MSPAKEVLCVAEDELNLLIHQLHDLCKPHFKGNGLPSTPEDDKHEDENDGYDVGPAKTLDIKSSQLGLHFYVQVYEVYGSRVSL